MKLTVCLSASLFALLAMPARLARRRAQRPGQSLRRTRSDGVPLAITQGPDRKTSPRGTGASVANAAGARLRARNWLLLDYERQFRGNAQTATLDRTINMYLQLGMNRDLSAVANDSSVTQTATPAAIAARHAQERFHAETACPCGPMVRPADTTLHRSSATYNSSIASAASQPFGSGSFSTKLPSSLAPGSIDTPQAPAPAPTPHRSLTELPPTTADTVDMQDAGHDRRQGQSPSRHAEPQSRFAARSLHHQRAELAGASGVAGTSAARGCRHASPGNVRQAGAALRATGSKTGRATSDSAARSASSRGAHADQQAAANSARCTRRCRVRLTCSIAKLPPDARSATATLRTWNRRRRALLSASRPPVAWLGPPSAPA